MTRRLLLSADVAPVTEPSRPAAPGEDGSGMSQIIEGGTNGRLEVALTFDAGADTGYAPQILDYLRDEGIKATFGMTGMWAEQNPDLVQRMVSEGHQLINHTWDHASLTGANTGMPPMTPDQVVQELSSTEDLVRNLTGYEMRPYFRPPYGDYDATTLGDRYGKWLLSLDPGGRAIRTAGLAGVRRRSLTTAPPTWRRTKSCSCT